MWGVLGCDKPGKPVKRVALGAVEWRALSEPIGKHGVETRIPPNARSFEIFPYTARTPSKKRTKSQIQDAQELVEITRTRVSALEG